MQAVVIDSYGSAEQMSVREIPTPEPSKFEVLVKVHAASINPVDWKVRRGDVRLLMSKHFPKVVGVDFAGTVESVGQKVLGIKAGDRVFGMCNPLSSKLGSYAQFVVARAEAMAKIPDGISFEEAASLPVAGLTALKALKDLMAIKSGQRLMINGASGGVGTFAVQIAKALGAYVIGICGAKNLDFVVKLGANEVLDYDKDAEEISRTHVFGFFDVAATSSFAQIKDLLEPKGVYVTTIPNALASIDAARTALFSKKKAKVVLAGAGNRVPAELTELAQLVVSGAVKPCIAKTISLSEVPLAHKEAEAGHNRGKIVIQVG